MHTKISCFTVDNLQPVTITQIPVPYLGCFNRLTTGVARQKQTDQGGKQNQPVIISVGHGVAMVKEWSKFNIQHV